MTTGTIDSYDPEQREGYIIPDTPDGNRDKIPFEAEALEKYNVTDLKKGDRVMFDVQGGMIGVFARDIRPLDNPAPPSS